MSSFRSIFGVSEPTWYRCCSFREKFEPADAPRPRPKSKGAKGKSKGKGGKGKSPGAPAAAAQAEPSSPSPRTPAAAAALEEEADLSPSKSVGDQSPTSPTLEDYDPSLALAEETKPATSKLEHGLHDDLDGFDHRNDHDPDEVASDPSEDADYEEELKILSEQVEQVGDTLKYINQHRQMQQDVEAKKPQSQSPDDNPKLEGTEEQPLPDVGHPHLEPLPTLASLESSPTGGDLGPILESRRGTESGKRDSTLSRSMSVSSIQLKHDQDEEYDQGVHLRARGLREEMARENFNAAPIFPTKKRGKRREGPKNPKVDELHDIFHDKIEGLGVGAKVELKRTVDPTVAVKDAVANYLKFQEEHADALNLSQDLRKKRGDQARTLAGDL